MTCSRVTLIVLAILLFLALVPRGNAANYFVVAGGAGNCSGSNWSNAAGAIPSTLSPGDMVYIGGATENLASSSNKPCAGERTHTFATSGTSGAHIQVIKCTSSISACVSAAGWQAGYGTTTAQWNDSTAASGTLLNPFWSFCPGSYYDVDGSAGTADQTGTYGIYMRAPGQMFGFIKADTLDCSNSNITDLSFKHIEIDGVEANSTENGQHTGAYALYVGSPVSTTATVRNLSFLNIYIHDVYLDFQSVGNVAGLAINSSWIYTNFSDPGAHSEVIGAQSAGLSSNGPALVDLTISGTVFRNIQGTAVLTCLTGVCQNWSVYSNLFYYTSDWDSLCEHGDSTATCGMSKLIGDNLGGSPGTIVNMEVYGNTIANIHLKQGQPGADDAGVMVTNSGSSGVNVQNNLWWNCTQAPLLTDTGSPAIISHDYNLWLNTGINATTLLSHDYQTSSGAADPFVNSAAYNFALSSETVDAHLNDGNTLPAPYNLDFVSTARGVDGSWERGAYEFTRGPQPPTHLEAVVQ